MMEERLTNALLDGIAKGIGYTLAGIVMALILVLLMFGSPESKTKMVGEPPCAVMIMANI